MCVLLGLRAKYRVESRKKGSVRSCASVSAKNAVAGRETGYWEQEGNQRCWQSRSNASCVEHTRGLSVRENEGERAREREEGEVEGGRRASQIRFEPASVPPSEQNIPVWAHPIPHCSQVPRDDLVPLLFVFSHEKSPRSGSLIGSLVVTSGMCSGSRSLGVFGCNNAPDSAVNTPHHPTPLRV